MQKQKKEGDEKKENDEPITHKSLEEKKVACHSCHFELIVGTGEIKQEGCLRCHDDNEALKKFKDKKLMHEKHVAGQEANCFNCHGSITHKAVQFVDPIINNCSNCHPDHHTYQKQLLLGKIPVKTEKAPALMFKVKTNCLGCHMEIAQDKKGEKIIKASAKSCVKCHTKRYEQMLKEWKAKIKEELTYVKSVKKEAEGALSGAKGKIDDETYKKAKNLFDRASENIRIVEFGNVVHNNKFSIVLIDSALNNFDETISLVQKN